MENHIRKYKCFKFQWLL